MKHTVITAMLLIAIFSTVFAEVDTTKVQIMKLDEVKPDMKAYGFTVFKGTKPERFEATISDIIFRPNGLESMPLIIGELSGGPRGNRMENIGVPAGASGSPVNEEQSNGLIGAVAARGIFDKDAIAYIQPIETMINDAQAFSNGASQLPIGFLNEGLTVPVHFSGPFPLSADVHTLFKQKNFYSLQSGISQSGISGLDSKEVRLQPGSSINIYLAVGDLNFFVNGTVTMIDGNSFYALGHPIFETGHTSLPISIARIVKTVPNYQFSYKIPAGDGDFIGVVDLDYRSGIKGTLGKKARMIPVSFKLRDGNNAREINCSVADVPYVTEWIISTFAYYVLQGGYQAFNMEGRSNNGSALITLQLHLSGYKKITLYPYIVTYNRETVYIQFSEYEKGLMNRILDPIAKSDLSIEKMVFNIEYTTQHDYLELDSLAFDSTTVVPGDTANLFLDLYLHNDKEKECRVNFPLVVPEGIETGKVDVHVKTGDRLIWTKLENRERISKNQALYYILSFENTNLFVKTSFTKLISDDTTAVQKDTVKVGDLFWEIVSQDKEKSVVVPVIERITPPLGSRVPVIADETLKLTVISEEQAQEQEKQMIKLEQKQKKKWWHFWRWIDFIWFWKS